MDNILFSVDPGAVLMVVALKGGGGRMTPSDEVKEESEASTEEFGDNSVELRIRFVMERCEMMLERNKNMSAVEHFDVEHKRRLTVELLGHLFRNPGKDTRRAVSLIVRDDGS